MGRVGGREGGRGRDRTRSRERKRGVRRGGNASLPMPFHVIDVIDPV